MSWFDIRDVVRLREAARLYDECVRAIREGRLDEHIDVSSLRHRIIDLAINGSSEQVGPACMNVPVPPTIADDDEFREAYVQGYRHALSDVRDFYDAAPSTGGQS